MDVTIAALEKVVALVFHLIQGSVNLSSGVRSMCMGGRKLVNCMCMVNVKLEDILN